MWASLSIYLWNRVFGVILWFWRGTRMYKAYRKMILFRISFWVLVSAMVFSLFMHSPIF